MNAFLVVFAVLAPVAADQYPPQYDQEMEGRARRAATSNAGRQLGYLHYLEEAGSGGRGGLRPNSKAWRMLHDPPAAWMIMQDSTFVKIAVEGSTVIRDPGVIAHGLIAPTTREYIDRYNVVERVLELQQFSLADLVAKRAFSSFSHLVGPHRNNDAHWLANTWKEEFVKLAPETLTNRAAAEQIITEELSRRAKKHGLTISRGSLRGAVGDAWNRVDTYLRQSGDYAGIRSLSLHLHPKVLRKRGE